MIVFPNAKINIGLNVVSKRPDGYHNLETIFYPVQITDALEMVPSEETKIFISGILIEGNQADNLVLKAYKLLKAEFNLPPVHFYLHKIIPTGAGLGGGSSNAAFALQMINDYFDLGLSSDKLIGLAGKIGADCSFFIQNKPVFATGIGNQLEKISLDLSKYQVLIAKPQISVSTAEAYRHIVPKQPEFSLKDISTVPINKWKDIIVNDFEESVFNHYPDIRNLKITFYQMGAIYASMSGSGSAVYGIFRHLPTNLDSFIPKGVLIYR